MGYRKHQPLAREVWALAGAQDDVVSREQLLELGFHPQAIKHRVARGRLHPIWPGVFAVGSPSISRRGRWRAALITCGPDAWLSHNTGAALLGVRAANDRLIEVSVPANAVRRRHGIRVHRRTCLEPPHVGSYRALAVTSPALTFVDLACGLADHELESAMKEADTLDLISPVELRNQLDDFAGMPGTRKLRRLLDRHTFMLTASELERLFVPIAISAGLPVPFGGQSVNGFDVDFFWPDLGLVVETDGLRYHRTPAQQTRDRVRDQTHSAAGLTPLRFTHAQVKFEAPYVRNTLLSVATRLDGHG